MMTTLIGYARCSTDKQDLAAQRAGLIALGVAPDRIYTDHGLTGTHRDRPVTIASGKCLLLPGDAIIPNSLTISSQTVVDRRSRL